MSDVSARILARMSVSVSVSASWNSSLKLGGWGERQICDSFQLWIKYVGGQVKCVRPQWETGSWFSRALYCQGCSKKDAEIRHLS